jgi:anti-anti-sigma regulatory factor
MQKHEKGPVRSTSVAVDIQRSPADTSIIRVRGELLSGATAPVWHSIERELLRAPGLVALDLSGVSGIDADGIHVLVSAASHAGEFDISFCLIGAHEGAVGAALADACLIDLFEILPAGTAL